MPSTIAIAITALAGAAVALPATTTSSSSAAATTTLSPAVARTTNFGLTLEAEEPYNGLSLVVEQSDNLGLKNLIFERPSAFAPSPFYLNGTEEEIQSFSYLNSPGSAADGGDFGIRLPEVGHAEGNSQAVRAIFSPQNPAFAIYNGTLIGQLTATTNAFFACNTTFNTTYGPSSVRLGLSYGNPTYSGENPEGCVRAKLAVVDLSVYDS